MRARKIRILKERIGYALDKKLINKIGWKDKDIVVQQFPLQPKRLILFNLSLNERLKGTSEYEDQDDFWEKQNREFKKLEKRYGKFGIKGKKVKVQQFNRFNKGKIYEEDLPKIQKRFNREAKKETQK